MLVAEGVVKRYGSATALDGFSLTVAAGEIAGLVGHNGAGKTTFVEIVTGLIRPDAGRVSIDGIDALRDRRAARHRLGLSPQELALYPNATVRQNLDLFAALASIRRATRRSAVARVVEELQLADVVDRPVGVLSGGQKRRVQAATALVADPPLLLLDEPTAGADPQTRAALLAAVRNRADEGAAVVYTTHYLPELVELDASIAVAKSGRIIARGDQHDLLKTLPGELRIRCVGSTRERLPLWIAERSSVHGDELRVSSADPAVDLAALLAAGLEPAAVDVYRPGLDELYRSLATADAAHA